MALDIKGKDAKTSNRDEIANLFEDAKKCPFLSKDIMDGIFTDADKDKNGLICGGQFGDAMTAKIFMGADGWSMPMFFAG